MTQDQYLEFIETAMNNYLANRTHVRRGQVYMNVLSVKHPRIYEEIVGTPADCFYDDNKVGDMLNMLVRNIK